MTYFYKQTNKQTKNIVLTCLTIWQSILQEEWIVSKQLATISTQEAFWVEVLANCIQAILQK
jgi:hypothetical protein